MQVFWYVLSSKSWLCQVFPITFKFGVTLLCTFLLFQATSWQLAASALLFATSTGPWWRRGTWCSWHGCCGCCPCSWCTWGWPRPSSPARPPCSSSWRPGVAAIYQVHSPVSGGVWPLFFPPSLVWCSELWLYLFFGGIFWTCLIWYHNSLHLIWRSQISLWEGGG